MVLLVMGNIFENRYLSISELQTDPKAELPVFQRKPGFPVTQACQIQTRNTKPSTSAVLK